MPVRASYSRQPTLSPPLNPPYLRCLVSRVMAAFLHVLQVATCAPVTPIPKPGVLVYVTCYPCQLFSTSIGWLFSFPVITRTRRVKISCQWPAAGPASQRHGPCTHESVDRTAIYALFPPFKCGARTSICILGRYAFTISLRDPSSWRVIFSCSSISLERNRVFLVSSFSKLTHSLKLEYKAVTHIVLKYWIWA